MPKVPINFENTLMYKFVCKDLSIKEIYVGSTTNYYKRKMGHKTSLNTVGKKEYNFKVYQYMRASGGWDNWLEYLEPARC